MKRKELLSWCLGFALLGSALPIVAQTPPASRYDVVVYGATSAGVFTAIAAGREHLRVALVEPGRHVGGMVTGGLSGSDIANPDVIGGLAREFFDRMGTYYNTAQYGHSTAWNFEPHVAEAALNDMLRQAGVTVAFDEPILLHQEGVRRGHHLEHFRTRTRDWAAPIFVDGSYEGDLLTLAGVSSTMGRESQQQYGEDLAGVRPVTPLNQLPEGLQARGPDGKLLAQISSEPLAAAGSGDGKVQSFNFRLILSSDPANQLPFTQPAGYDPAAYALFHGLWPLLDKQLGHPAQLGDIFRIVPIPNRKADFNNSGGFSTDYLNQSWTYLKLDAAGRRRIFDEHRAYTQGMLYFLSHDASVPLNIRTELRGYGYARDEFVDTDHWPPQLYIREGRRMVGEIVLTERDLVTDRTKPDTIGMGSHNIDSHNVQRIVSREGYAWNEGDVEVHVQPYAIPYRVLLPKASEADNLLVPMCVSASHMAYSSLRMEPQYMILGQAAGEAAALAIRQHTSVQQVDVAALQHRLEDAGAILSYPIKTNYVVQ